MAEELTFHLEEFKGPLELLLALVSKHKMDLHNIPILELIDQYTRTVEAAQAVDPDISSSFIEMAAHLVEMKSYLLLPPEHRGRADEAGAHRPAHRVRPVPPDGLCPPRRCGGDAHLRPTADAAWNGTRLTPSTICLRCWPTAGRA